MNQVLAPAMADLASEFNTLLVGDETLDKNKTSKCVFAETSAGNCVFLSAKPQLDPPINNIKIGNKTIILRVKKLFLISIFDNLNNNLRDSILLFIIITFFA